MSDQNKPKLLLVSGTPPPLSGPEIMTAQLLASPLKESVEIIHFNISKGRPVETKARFDLVNIFYGLIQPIQLVWLLAKHRPDAVYTNLAQNLGGFLRYASFILICAAFRKPVIVRVMGDGFNHFYRRAPLPLRLLIQLTLRHIDLFIVRSEALKAQFEGAAPLEKLRVVYSGIDTTEFDRPRSRPQDGLVQVLFVGYLSQAKGALDLLKAVPKITAANPGIRIHLMGARLDKERNITYINNPSSNQATIEGLLASPEIGPFIQLLGTKAGKEKIDEYLNADIFVLPSYSEAFPTVVLEAMAAGLPVVATPVGALPEVFDERNILFVEPGDIDNLAKAILRLAENPELRATMGACNRETVRSRFNLESHARAMEKVIAEAISRE